jgi:hypothetical protein
MSKTKYLKGECQHCAGHLEFLAEHIGMFVPCPHCQQETELLLPTPPEEPTVPRRALIWTGIAVVVLGLGFLGALMALKRAEKWAQRQKPQAAVVGNIDTPANPAPVEVQQTNVLQDQSASAAQDLATSSVSIQKTSGSSLRYAVGTLRNLSNRQRFGLKVQVELLDATGQKVGAATDYRQVLEPGTEWEFKALIVESKAASARIASIAEDK